MKITSNKLLDLYRRLLNYITTNYPTAIVTENTNSTMINYSGELARIFIYQEKQRQLLMVKLSTDITCKMSDSNGKIFYISTLDDLNSLKSGLQIIMEMQYPAGTAPEKPLETHIQKAQNGQGYLADSNGNVIATVYLDCIPTNAFVHSTDKINAIPADEIEATPEEKGRIRGRMASFFKK